MKSYIHKFNPSLLPVLLS